MIMKNIRLIIICIITLFAVISCDKNKIPVIEFISPNENQVFSAGETIHIKVKIYDDGDSIMSEELLVTSSSGNDTVINIKKTEFKFEYLFEESFTGKSNTQYKIKVIAGGGHGNRTDKSVTIQCN